ncbi:helix-turn-helix domain-containing protein, partial [Enterococcus mundtii]|uniref:helix-turn-helix domain-containing protein n=1 Tax=Enterococcus mundtii TaxID=53346 RepID=UPI00403D49C6
SQNEVHSDPDLILHNSSVLIDKEPKDPQRRLVYKSIVEDLENGVAISKIAKDYNVTRQTVYRIKEDSMSLSIR